MYCICITDDGDIVSAVKVPTAILAAEFDRIFPVEQVKQLGEMLASKSEVRKPWTEQIF